ncbi:MAG: TldD/PmbA family protein [Candidatus Hydrothermarchaeota archaeon]|nr:TldD/PmbA family protein [Candidatus Hydrothermarchaeota archaeon]
MVEPESVVKNALRLGAQDVVVSSESKSTTQVKFVNDQVAVSQSWSEDKLDIFLALDKRLVSTTITPHDQESTDLLLEKLLSRARVTAPKEEYNGIAEGPFKYKKVIGGYDKKVAHMENHGALIKDAIEASKEEGAKRASGVLETCVYSRSLFTSNGVAAAEDGTTLFLSIRAFAGDGSGHGVSCSRGLDKFEPLDAGRRAGEIARLGKKPVNGRKGEYRVLFDPLAFAPLVEVTGEAASIFSVEAGFSYLADKLGRRIGNNNITLTDDARLEDGFLSRSFDEEGVPTQRNLILQKGVLMGYLHNTSTARRYGTETTANAGLIRPRPWNLVLRQGRGRRKDRLEELDHGIYITNTWYTRFQNYMTWDFSTMPRDGIFLVEGGEIQASLKGIRISDNLSRIFKSVEWASKERKQIRSWEVGGSVTSPWVIVDGLRITRATR